MSGKVKPFVWNIATSIDLLIFVLNFYVENNFLKTELLDSKNSCDFRVLKSS